MLGSDSFQASVFGLFFGVQMYRFLNALIFSKNLFPLIIWGLMGSLVPRESEKSPRLQQKFKIPRAKNFYFFIWGLMGSLVPRDSEKSPRLQQKFFLSRGHSLGIFLSIAQCHCKRNRGSFSGVRIKEKFHHQQHRGRVTKYPCH